MDHHKRNRNQTRQSTKGEDNEAAVLWAALWRCTKQLQLSLCPKIESLLWQCRNLMMTIHDSNEIIWSLKNTNYHMDEI